MQKYNAVMRETQKTRARFAVLAGTFLLIGAGLSGTLSACAPTNPHALTQTADLAAKSSATETATPLPTDSPTEIPATITPSPSLTATPPFSPAVTQALRDAFNCITNNLSFAPGTKLTDFCPGYWSSSWSNTHDLDGVLIRSSLEPYMSPLSNLRWRFNGLSDIQKDEVYSTKVNQIYTGTLSTTLSGDVNLACPSGTPAPFQTSVSIPINGEVRISVYNYLGQPRETVRIESWKIDGNPLQDYCATLH
jgi:hypothetical protein